MNSRKALVVYAVLLTLASASAAQAAKPKITAERFGNGLRVTFVAPVITSRETRYFVRYETTRQEGCVWKTTSIGRHGRPGQMVVVSLLPSRLLGDGFCPGQARITVFLQRSYGGFVEKGATAATFKLVGRVTYQMPA